MHENWGAALTRTSWLAQKPIRDQYWELVKDVDYSQRDNSAIRAFYASLGYRCEITSQDASRWIACRAAGLVRIMTKTCHARYVGVIGEHSNRDFYERWKFGRSTIFPKQPVVRRPSKRDIDTWLSADAAAFAEGYVHPYQKPGPALLESLLDQDGKVDQSRARELHPEIQNRALDLRVALSQVFQDNRTGESWVEQDRARQGSRKGVVEMIHDPTTESDQTRFSEKEVISALYRSLLGRTPDPAGFDHHMRSVRDNGLAYVVGDFVRSPEFRNKYQSTPRPEPLWNYAASFDPVQTVLAHENHAREAVPNHRVNFFGVAVNVGRFVPLLRLDNILEPPPIPGNWHADVAEFGATLRAVERCAGNSFVMAELGCGWGCWMNITAAAARLAGKRPFVIGVEGDEGHLEFAREALATNGVSTAEYRLVHGIAAAKSGTAFFPKQERAGAMWGLSPVFAESGDHIKSLMESKKFNELKIVSLSEVMGEHPHLHLLHIDIQGGETSLIRDSIDILNQRVSYIVVGTHSRMIDGEIIDILTRDGGWKLEIERPCFFTIDDGRPQTGMDGVQGWYNSRF